MLKRQIPPLCRTKLPCVCSRSCVSWRRRSQKQRCTLPSDPLKPAPTASPGAPSAWRTFRGIKIKTLRNPPAFPPARTHAHQSPFCFPRHVLKFKLPLFLLPPTEALHARNSASRASTRNKDVLRPAWFHARALLLALLPFSGTRFFFLFPPLPFTPTPPTTTCFVVSENVWEHTLCSPSGGWVGGKQM